MMNNLSFSHISADVWVKRPNSWVKHKQRQSCVPPVKLLRVSTQLKVSSYLSKLIWFCLQFKVEDVAALKECRG